VQYATSRTVVAKSSDKSATGNDDKPAVSDFFWSDWNLSLKRLSRQLDKPLHFITYNISFENDSLSQMRHCIKRLEACLSLP